MLRYHLLDSVFPPKRISVYIYICIHMYVCVESEWGWTCIGKHSYVRDDQVGVVCLFVILVKVSLCSRSPVSCQMLRDASLPNGRTFWAFRVYYKHRHTHREGGGGGSRTTRPTPPHVPQAAAKARSHLSTTGKAPHLKHTLTLLAVNFKYPCPLFRHDKHQAAVMKHRIVRASNWVPGTTGCLWAVVWQSA